MSALNLTVEDIQEREDLQFISDSQDVQAIKELIPDAKPYDSFFVKVEEGDYTEVYGMYGIVPYFYKFLEKLA